MTRHITPHKGGRTVMISARLTPEEKRRLTALLKQQLLSLSDYLMKSVTRDEQEQQINDR